MDRILCAMSWKSHTGTSTPSSHTSRVQTSSNMQVKGGNVSIGPRQNGIRLKDDPEGVFSFVDELMKDVRANKLSAMFVASTHCTPDLYALLSGGEPFEAWAARTAARPGAQSRCLAKWNTEHTAYRCLDCGITPSSCICVECFNESDHEGHSYSLYTSSLGGCCDCGDAFVWKKEGSCKRHPGPSLDCVSSLEPDVLLRARALLRPVCSTFLYCVGHPLLHNEVPVLASFLNAVCNCADGLRRLVCDEFVRPQDKSVLDDSPLPKMNRNPFAMRSDESAPAPGITIVSELLSIHASLPSPIESEVSGLYLALLFDPVFKYEFSLDFFAFYHEMQINCVSKKELYAALDKITVQILTISDVALKLLEHHDIMGILLGTMVALLEKGALSRIGAFSNADNSQACTIPVMNTGSSIVSDSLLWAVSHDIRFLLAHAQCARLITQKTSNISQFYRAMAMLHGMNPQKRIPSGQPHVQYDDNEYSKPSLMEESMLFIQNQMIRGAVELAFSEIDTEAESGRQALKMHAQQCTQNIIELVQFEYAFPSNSEQILNSDPLRYECFLPFVCSSDSLSTHCPLHRSLARICIAVAHGALSPSRRCIDQQLLFPTVPLQPFLDSDFDLLHLMEHPLRALVQLAQVRANLWVRNGLNVKGPSLMYSMNYWSDITLNLDIALLQAIALSTKNIDCFINALFSKFEALDYFFEIDDSNLTASNHTIAWHVLATLLQILSPVGSTLCVLHDDCQVLDQDAFLQSEILMLRHDIIQCLCVADSSFSSVVQRVSAKWNDDHVQINKVLNEVATFSADRFKLRQENWNQFDPYYLHFSDQDRSSANERFNGVAGSAFLERKNSSHPLARQLLHLFRNSRLLASAILSILLRFKSILIVDNSPKGLSRSIASIVTFGPVLTAILRLLLHMLNNSLTSQHSELNASTDISFNLFTEIQSISKCGRVRSGCIFELLCFLRKSSLAISIHRVVQHVLVKIGSLFSSYQSHINEVCGSNMFQSKVMSISTHIEQQPAAVDSELRALKKGQAKIRQAMMLEQFAQIQLDFMKKHHIVPINVKSPKVAVSSNLQVCPSETGNPVSDSTRASVAADSIPTAESFENERVCSICFQNDEHDDLNFVAHLHRSSTLAQATFNSLTRPVAAVPSVVVGDSSSVFKSPLNRDSQSHLDSEVPSDQQLALESLQRAVSSRNVNFEHEFASGVLQDLDLIQVPAAHAPDRFSNSSVKPIHRLESGLESTSVSSDWLDYELLQHRDRFSVQVRTCGHFLHSSCFENYMTGNRQQMEFLEETSMTLSLNRGDFFCPQCRGRANALIPVPISDDQMQELKQPVSSFSDNRKRARIQFQPEIAPLHDLLAITEAEMNDVVSDLNSRRVAAQLSVVGETTESTRLVDSNDVEVSSSGSDQDMSDASDEFESIHSESIDLGMGSATVDMPIASAPIEPASDADVRIRKSRSLLRLLAVRSRLHRGAEVRTESLRQLCADAERERENDSMLEDENAREHEMDQFFGFSSAITEAKRAAHDRLKTAVFRADSDSFFAQDDDWKQFDHSQYTLTETSVMRGTRVHVLELIRAVVSQVELAELAHRYALSRPGVDHLPITEILQSASTSGFCGGASIRVRETIAALFRSAQTLRWATPEREPSSEFVPQLLKLFNLSPQTVGNSAPECAVRPDVILSNPISALVSLAVHCNYDVAFDSIGSLFTLYCLRNMIGLLQWTLRESASRESRIYALGSLFSSLSSQNILTALHIFQESAFSNNASVSVPHWFSVLLKWVGLPFLRQAALFVQACLPASRNHRESHQILRRAETEELSLDSFSVVEINSEFDHLCSFLHLQQDCISSLVLRPCQTDLALASALSTAIGTQSLAVLRNTDFMYRLSIPIVPTFLPLPHVYQRLFTLYLKKACPRCELVPKEPAICLFCHGFVCLGGQCCLMRTPVDEDLDLSERDQNRHVNAEASFHARVCGGGNGVFLLLKLTSILMFVNDKRCLLGSLYLDDHGEEDLRLHRGRPLYLNAERLEKLQRMWACNSMFEESGKPWHIDANLF